MAESKKAKAEKKKEKSLNNEEILDENGLPIKRTTNRSRLWLLEHYPDDPAQKTTLDDVSNLSNCSYAYICHDRDTKEMRETELVEMQEKLKALGVDIALELIDREAPVKPHYHILLKFENARTVDQVAKSTHVPERLCKNVKDERRWLRYFLHLDHPAKYQYKDFEITSNYNWKCKAFTSESEESMLIDILNHIESLPLPIYWTDVYKWVLQKGYYSAYRRNYHILRDIVRENNNPLMG